MACLSEDAKGAETAVQLVMGIDPSSVIDQLASADAGELFESKGLVIHSRGYLEVYIYENWSERHMPNFQLAEVIRPNKIDVSNWCIYLTPLLVIMTEEVIE